MFWRGYKPRVKRLHRRIKHELRIAQNKLNDANARNDKDLATKIVKDLREDQEKLYSEINCIITTALSEQANALVVPLPENTRFKEDFWETDRGSNTSVLTSLGRKTLEADIYEARRRHRDSVGFWFGFLTTMGSLLIALGSLYVAVLALKSEK